MWRRCISVCIGLGLWAWMAAGTGPRRAWWPLPENYGITSHFADYRWQARLHAGVDFSTNLRIGRPVRVWQAGEIYRIRVDRRGYGRALYIRHADGTTTLYAHLDRFENDRLHLEDLVQRIRKRTGRKYFGSIFLESPIPVATRQVIAFSGESGAGLPHLHVEIRDPDQRPLNPLQRILHEDHDRQRPVIQGVLFRPATPTTLVQGRPLDLWVIPRGRRAEEFPAISITLTGPVDVLLAVADSAVRPSFRTPARIRAWLDDVLFYEWHPTAFAFTDRNRTGFVYGATRARGDLRVTPLRLTDTAGAPPSLVSHTIAGPLDVPPGTHELRFEVWDYNANRTVFRLRVVRRSPVWIDPLRAAQQSLYHPYAIAMHPAVRLLRRLRMASFWQPPVPPSVPVITGTVIPTRNRAVDLEWVGFGRMPFPMADRPRWIWSDHGAVWWVPPETAIQMPQTRPPRTYPPWVCDLSGCAMQWPWRMIDRIPRVLVEWYGPWKIYRIEDPHRRVRFRFGEGFIWTVPPDGVWDATVLAAIPQPPTRVPEGLVPITRAYRLVPPDLPFKRPHTLEFRPSRDIRSRPAGIFLFHPQKHTWLFNGRMPDAPFRMDMYQPVEVLIAEDRAPPRILRPGSPDWRWRELDRLRIPVREVGLGLREDRIRLHWDGQPVPADTVEYDPDWEAIVYRPTSPPDPGWHTVDLWIEDWAGLSASARLRIRVLRE